MFVAQNSCFMAMLEQRDARCALFAQNETNASGPLGFRSPADKLQNSLGSQIWAECQQGAGKVSLMTAKSQHELSACAEISNSSETYLKLEPPCHF